MSEDLFFKIRNACHNKELSLGLNLIRLNSPGSPVHKASDNNIVVLFLVAMVIINFLQSWIWGLLSVVAVLIIFVMFGRKWVFYRLRKRTEEFVLTNYNNWNESWNKGYLSLSSNNLPDHKCLSPNDSWELFIQNLDIQDHSEENKVIKKQINQKGFFDDLMDTIKSFIKWFVILVIIGGIIAFFYLN